MFNRGSVAPLLAAAAAAIKAVLFLDRGCAFKATLAHCKQVGRPRSCGRRRLMDHQSTPKKKKQSTALTHSRATLTGGFISRSRAFLVIYSRGGDKTMDIVVVRFRYARLPLHKRAAACCWIAGLDLCHGYIFPRG
jgi:hypothetical protein